MSDPAQHERVHTVRDYALSIVDGPSLADKLRPPPASLVDALDDDTARAPLVRERPARDASLALADAGGKLPPLNALRDPMARAACLSRFAHHELCAVELFAWALLALPSLPPALRRGFVQTLAEEQLHCRLYLERLAAHGVPFGAGGPPLTDYFWRHVGAIASARDPASAFLCAMGLTLEQANLDFTLMYRDAFRAAGDEETALVIQRVHDDEIGHVKLATTWLKRLAAPAASRRSSSSAAARAPSHDDASDVAAYAAHVPFPFSLARAKGRRFDEKARERAGLSRAMIDAVRGAKPYGRG